MGSYWLKEMDPMVRFNAMIRGEKVDRVPVLPFALGHCAHVMGHPNLGDFYSKLDVNVKCQMLARELYGWDQPTMLMNPGYYCADWGGEIEYPYRPTQGSIACKRALVQTPEDMDKMQVPDPSKVPSMHALLDGLKLAISYKQLPTMVWIHGGWISSTARGVVQLDKFLLWLYKAPDLVNKSLDMTMEYGNRVMEYLVNEVGNETWLPFDTCPIDSNVLVSPEFFGKFPLPRVIKLHQKGLDLGLPMWFTHWCGNHNPNINAGHVDQVPMGEPGLMHFDDTVPLSKSIERFGNKNIILGNVNTTSLLLKPYEEVYDLCKRNIEMGKNAPKGYMVTAACELPPRAPPMNVYAMVKAAREYGRY